MGGSEFGREADGVKKIETINLDAVTPLDVVTARSRLNGIQAARGSQGRAKQVVQATASVGFVQKPSSSVIPPSLSNTIAALNELRGSFRYDVFHDRMIVRHPELDKRGELTFDDTCLVLRTMVAGEYGFEPSRETMADAVRRLCVENSFDPVRDYFDGLEWDGVARVDRWLTMYLGARDDALNRAVGRKVLVAGVRRVRRPGCKFDFCMVWEGPQGAGKSEACRALAGSDGLYSDNPILAAGTKEQQELVAGVLIYEIAELKGIRRAEVEQVKVFFSKTHDSARPAYGRSRVDRPRRCVFIGTTNDKQYLTDDTGNRRFWPVEVGEIDLEGLRRDRDQLWAEAAAMETGGEVLTLPRELWGAMTERQGDRLQSDPWELVLVDVVKLSPQTCGNITLHEGKWKAFSSYLLETVLRIDRSVQRTEHERRLGVVMRRLGWDGPKPLRVGDRVNRGYVKEGL